MKGIWFAFVLVGCSGSGFGTGPGGAAGAAGTDGGPSMPVDGEDGGRSDSESADVWSVLDGGAPADASGDVTTLDAGSTGGVGGAGGQGAAGSASADAGGTGGFDGGTSSHDAAPDALPRECVTDLSGVQAADFLITFTVTTTTTGVYMSLVRQLTACITCGESGAGWAIAMTPGGGIHIETSDGDPSHRVFAIGGGPVNDGVPHRVAAGRTNGMLWVQTDEGPASVPSPFPYGLGALPPLTVGLSHCGPSTCWSYEALSGSVSDICMSRK